ncbi:MAG: HAD family hydrolase [Clostridium sp.]|nr:HAD family hydrolase [Clostridium sp.]
MERLTDLKGIIFDYGGTIDSRGVHWSEVIWDAYCACGVEIEKDTFRDAYVFAERELARTRHILPHHNFLDLLTIKMRIELQWLADEGFLPAEAPEVWAEAIALRCDQAARASVEEARPVLERLSVRYPMVLVSNFYGNVESVLREYRLDRYFRAIVESAVVGVRKPDPAIFSLGVDALGLKPSEVLVVGDSLKKDILPARSIGCHTAWLKGKGWTAAEDAAEDPSMIKNLSELLEVAL